MKPHEEIEKAGQEIQTVLAGIIETYGVCAAIGLLDSLKMHYEIIFGRSVFNRIPTEESKAKK